MTIGSRVNPNFPIPGISQSAKGFRDNFSVIKKEIENLQSKQIQMVGDVTCEPTIIDSGAGPVILVTTAISTSLAAAGDQYTLQFNNSGILGGANVYYDQTNVRLGVGRSTPLSTLDINGNLRVANSTVGFGNLSIDSELGQVVIGTDNSANLVINTSGNASAIITSIGHIGIGTINPIAQLDVTSNLAVMSRFYSGSNSTDNGVRFLTDQPLSSFGLILEQTNANQVGGISIDKNGNISLHSGENSGSSLSVSTERLTITPAGYVGISTNNPYFQLTVNGTFGSAGINDQSTGGTGIWIANGNYVGISNNNPLCELDVLGNISSSGTILASNVQGTNQFNIHIGSSTAVSITSNMQKNYNLKQTQVITPTAVNTSATIIDTWPIANYRSAKYLIQVVNGSSVELNEVLVVQNGTSSYSNQIGTVNTGVGLGNITTDINSGNVEVKYTGSNSGNSVSVQATYFAI